MGRPLGSVDRRTLSEGSLKRLRADWVDLDRTMLQMIKRYGMGGPQIQRLCADLPPRTRGPKAKRQAPMGLRGLL